jgi:hypothetical protein
VLRATLRQQNAVLHSMAMPLLLLQSTALNDAMLRQQNAVLLNDAMLRQQNAMLLRSILVLEFLGWIQWFDCKNAWHLLLFASKHTIPEHRM